MSRPQLLAVDANTSTGSIVWWGLHGDVSFAQLAAAWVEAGLAPDDLPSEPTPARALGRAVAPFKGRDTIVRALDEVDADTGAAKTGFTVLRKSKDARTGKPIFETWWEAWLAPGAPAETDPLLALPSGAEPDEEIVELVVLKHRYELGQLAHSDIGSWLVRNVYASHGIALRESGGVYFVPVAAMPAWRAMGAVLARVSAGRIFETPVLRAEQAVEAILASLLREAEDEAKSLDEALNDADLGKRALEGRAARAAAMDAKLASYEALLGANADAMRARMVTLGAGLMTAAMRAA